MSRMVMAGKAVPHGSSVPSSRRCRLRGPVEPMHPPSTFTQMTKNLFVSMGSPGPTMRLHQPGLPVSGWGSATYWSPVSAWQTRIALSRLSDSVP